MVYDGLNEPFNEGKILQNWRNEELWRSNNSGVPNDSNKLKQQSIGTATHADFLEWDGNIILFGDIR